MSWAETIAKREGYMMVRIPEFRDEVLRFRDWARTNQDTFRGWECCYKHWDWLYAEARRAIWSLNNESVADDVESDLLYAIARDYEGENIRRFLAKSPVSLEVLAQRAVAYDDPDARWQIALSVADARLPNAAELIRPFLTDSDEYVRRRALMAIAPFSPAEAESIAIANLNDEFEYSRIAALHVLHRVGSSRLEEFLNRHEHAPDEYVRRIVQEIRDALQNQICDDESEKS